MAAGLGSRFGGLKQLTAIDKGGNFIIDYSINHAITAGFNKVIFIINPKDILAFKETIIKRIKDKISYSFAFQKKPKNSPISRTKPWGTGHALYCALPQIKSNFAVINADDYYGKDAFQKASKLLDNDNQNGLISFKLQNTFSGIEKYKRGICKTEKGFLKQIEECEVEKTLNGFECISLVTSKKEVCKGDMQTSMNFWCFSKDIIPLYKQEFKRQINYLMSTNPESGEIFLPSIISKLIISSKLKIQVIKSSSKVKGLTYKSDLMLFKN